MKRRFLNIVSLLLICIFSIKAQDRPAFDRLIRFYYDNDFINVTGKGTDNEYTGGMRVDYFYTRKTPSRSILDRWMPKAGNTAVNTYGWSLMQVGFTPDNIKTTEPDVADYPYAGGLFATHTLHSSDPTGQFLFKTELLAGILGPYSFVKETQEGIHHLINYQQPMGWDKQMPTDLLLNLNFTAEKMLWQAGNWLEVSGGANVQVGTMTDAANLYGLVRLGKMTPYYKGYISQYSSPRVNRPRTQIYFVGRPGLSLTAYNAYVDGGVFNGRSSYYRSSHNGSSSYVTDRNIHPFVDAGLVVSSGKISLALTQKIMPALLKDYPPHAVGNFSFTVSW